MFLFTLVLILRFGVTPALQGPSPNPPSTTLRGLYLLACFISSVVGSALGIFFFNFTKFWVSACGGFAFGWFLLATKSGGLAADVLGRWGILGGMTVAAFLSSLVPRVHDGMMLVSTAWIGASAFVLGVDCYSRAGLKEVSRSLLCRSRSDFGSSSSIISASKVSLILSVACRTHSLRR